MPTILIDADGCPVVDLTVQIGRAHGVPVKILCDTAHRIQRKSAETLVFDKGADSVDFALVNRVTPGDIVITQDYGLATMCLARRARVLNQKRTGVHDPEHRRPVSPPPRKQKAPPCRQAPKRACQTHEGAG